MATTAKVRLRDRGAVRDAVADIGLTRWWARNERVLRDAATQTIQRLGRGHKGRVRQDKLAAAVRMAYKVNISRPAHYGLWGDQSAVLAKYPNAQKPMEALVKGRVERHAKPMVDRFQYRLAFQRLARRQVRVRLTTVNKAFYATFVESKGYRVTSHIGPAWERWARHKGAEI